MNKGAFALFFVAITLCLAAVTWAAELSADVVTTTQGRTMTSKIIVKGDKSRMEGQGRPGYTIVRKDKEVIWLVNPAQKSYMEMKLNQSRQPGVGEKVQGEISRKLLGSETIDAHPAQKYEVTYTAQGKTTKMYQWMATDIKFPVKMAAADGSWTTEYKNIKMGGQTDDLFEVPGGYTKSEMPSIPGMPKGMAMPKQPE
jgi:hypothetical protein